MLFDIGVVSTPEPFKKLVHQGIVLGEDNQKMSKSRGNVVNPDEMMDQFGADAVRLYEMFMGPLEAVKPWNTRGVEGITRFLERVWRLMVNEEGRLSSTVVDTVPAFEHRRLLHQTIKKVTEDIEELRFNTAISQMMVFTNEMTKAEQRSRALLEPFVLLLAPFAPHLCKNCGRMLGHQPSVSQQPWPIFDPALIVSDRLTIPIQVNGKLRAKLDVGADATREQIERWLVAQIAEWLQGKEPKKIDLCRKKAYELCGVADKAGTSEKGGTCAKSEKGGMWRNGGKPSPLLPVPRFLLVSPVDSSSAAVINSAWRELGLRLGERQRPPRPRHRHRGWSSGRWKTKRFEPNLETRYTNYLRHEFSSGSGAQVVPESEAADLVLSGQILSVILPTLSFTQTTTLESRTEVVGDRQGGGDQDATCRVGANGEGRLGVLS